MIGKTEDSDIEPEAPEYEYYFNGMSALLLSNDWSYWFANIGNDDVFQVSPKHLRLWKMLDLFPEIGDAEFLRVSAPAPGNEGVTVSAYVAPSEDRVLVVAANLGSNELSGITLDVDDAALGLSGSGLDRYLSLDTVVDTCALGGGGIATRPALHAGGAVDFGNTSGKTSGSPPNVGSAVRHIGCLSTSSPSSNIQPQVLNPGALPVPALARGGMRLFLLCKNGQSCVEPFDLPRVARLRFDTGEQPEWEDSRETNNASGNATLDETLFNVSAFAGENAFHTGYEQSRDIHSQFKMGGAQDWKGYEVRGRLLFTNNFSGIGVTAYGYQGYPGVGSASSELPDQGDGVYYRLWRHRYQRTFELTMGGVWRN